MKNSYSNLIKQSFKFPQEGFDLNNGFLTFHGVSLQKLIKKYGTPFRLFYLPNIGKKINRARNIFEKAIKKHKYNGNYHYCYCTKCNHFSHVISAAIQHNVHLETSSSFDIDLILNLHNNGTINTDLIVINNGYKTTEYLKKIISLYDIGFKNVLVVLDNKSELKRLTTLLKGSDKKIKIGLRMAINEEAQSSYYTSRMGIRHNEVLNFFQEEVENNDYVELKMLHFFVDSGIKDSLYFWEEFNKALKLYIDLKKQSISLDAFNLGGGFPIRNNLGFDFDYEYMANEIIKNIKERCVTENINEPHVFTEFGKYTVGESGAIIFEVLEQKQQNDNENWYLINNSLMNTIPDAWSIKEKFILLPVNKWSNEYKRANIGGISCDRSDYYNSEDFNQEVLLPTYTKNDKEPLYLGFFHTGAYQDAISGYGGIKHCLIPSPIHVIIDKDKDGNLIDYVYQNEQSAEEMFKLLGYK
ncbi:MAG: arginine decarboxylase [Flavobacteriales bacterium]|nr:arginine decarboxylase [Flavobacteriales bacterium]